MSPLLSKQEKQTSRLDPITFLTLVLIILFSELITISKKEDKKLLQMSISKSVKNKRFYKIYDKTGKFSG